MTTPSINTKVALREQTRARLKTIPAAKRLDASATMCVRLTEQKVWTNARSVSFFAPMPEEPDIWPLVLQAMTVGKIVALPRFSRPTQSYVVCHVKDLQADIQIGAFGIREPAEGCPEVPLNRLDLVLVPGLAFDLSGRRLGKGKGFYDRLLSGASGTKCGVAFDEQIVTEVPTGPHDVCVNCILTPTRWIET